MSCLMTTYKEDCDYLRERFNLDVLVSIYEIIHRATEFIRETDALKEIEQFKSQETENLKKEKKPCQKKKVLKSKSKKSK